MVFPVRVLTKICILAFGPPAETRGDTHGELTRGRAAAAAAGFRQNIADPAESSYRRSTPNGGAVEEGVLSAATGFSERSATGEVAALPPDQNTYKEFYSVYRVLVLVYVF